jgi:hypothetical protein
MLAFELEASFFDGVATAQTNGLFDPEDLPPWDTWLSYGSFPSFRGDVLLSWIPKTFVPLAELAIRAHMCDAYRWV